MSEFPVQVKGANKNAASWIFDNNPRKYLAYYKGGDGQPVITFAGWKETDGASVLSLQRLGEGLRVAGNFAARSCELGWRPRGKALTPQIVKESDSLLIAFPVFMRDKDRVAIIARVWTDEVHGGSVSVWCVKVVLGSLSEVAQYMQVAFQACDVLRTMAKKYTRV